MPLPLVYLGRGGKGTTAKKFSESIMASEDKFTKAFSNNIHIGLKTSDWINFINFLHLPLEGEEDIETIRSFLIKLYKMWILNIEHQIMIYFILAPLQVDGRKVHRKISNLSQRQ